MATGTEAKAPLPIVAFTPKIVEAVRSSQVTVIAAETGAGKSTLTPLMLLEAGFGSKGQIGVTEPRRVAAMNVASYVAELHGTELGKVVGYQIGGEKVQDRTTRVRFMTDGILLNELHTDPLLRKYEVVLVDEAHERGVNQDLIIALLKQVLRKRADLKVVVMSATIDESRFSEFFGGAPVVQVPGRVFPVDVSYLDEDESYGNPVELCARKIRSLLGRPGDILVFLPDEKSIKEVAKKVDSKDGNTRVLPLYGSQAPDEQREVFRRDQRRRVILATNVAETSVTIDGIVHVVDSGLIKAVKYVDASMSALQVMEHSQAGCKQRAGRAGRTAAGFCHRMFTESSFLARPQFTEPEIKRMSLDQVLLHLRALGYTLDEVKGLEFMDAPGDDRWQQAQDRLTTLGAVSKDGSVASDGFLMDKLPLAPMLGRMLITASRLGVGREAATVAAGLTSRSVFVRPKDKEREASASHEQFKDPLSDGLTVIDVVTRWEKQGDRADSWARENFLSSKALNEIDRNRRQIVDVLRDEDMIVDAEPVKTHEALLRRSVLLRKAICAGLLVNLCVKSSSFGYTRGGKDVYIFPGSALFKQSAPKYLVCAAVVETSKPFARDCTAMEDAWLTELLPEDACDRKWKFELSYGYGDDRPEFCEQLFWQGNLISQKRVTTFPPAAHRAIAERLTQETRDGRSSLIHPMTRTNETLWRDTLVAMDIVWSDYERRDLLAKQLTDYYERKLVGVSSFDELAAIDIRLRAEDWLTPEVLARHKERLEEQRRQAERHEQERATERAREEAAKQKRDEEAKPSKDRIFKLLGELERIGGDSDIESDLLNCEASLNFSWVSFDQTRSRLDSIEMSIERLKKTSTAKVLLTETIWRAVLDKYPNCPLCSEPWESGEYLTCSRRHDLRSVVPLTSDSFGQLCQFMTDRDEAAADVFANGSRVAVHVARARGCAWTGKKFKTVTSKVYAVVLPDQLMGQRSQLLLDLGELTRLKTQVAQTTKQITGLEEKHGKLLRLTFATIDGLSACKVNGTRYQAAFTGQYPQPGETWLCRKGHEVSGADEGYEVHPEFRVSGLPAEKDVEELKVVLREFYPGLPERLFE